MVLLDFWTIVLAVLFAAECIIARIGKEKNREESEAVA
jgi:hypothetical protein